MYIGKPQRFGVSTFNFEHLPAAMHRNHTSHALLVDSRLCRVPRGRAQANSHGYRALCAGTSLQRATRADPAQTKQGSKKLGQHSNLCDAWRRRTHLNKYHPAPGPSQGAPSRLRRQEVSHRNGLLCACLHPSRSATAPHQCGHCESR